jgi:uncharacterized membrane protein YoaK (UPF0700 family)
VTKRGQVPLAVPTLLSFVAGYVDSCTFLALFGVFVAQITGSFVIAGTELITHDDHVLIKVLAIPMFFFAGMVTTLVVAATDARRYGALPWTLTLEEILLAGFVSLGLAGSPFHDPNSVMALAAALLGLSAMGVQSALVRLLMRGVGSTNVMTTNTTQLAIDLAEVLLCWRKKHRMKGDADAAGAFSAACRQFGNLLPVVLGFLLGTLVGASAYVQVGLWCVLAAMLIIAGLIIWSLHAARGHSALA